MRYNDITHGNGLEEYGITNASMIYWTSPTAVLYEQIIKRGDGLLSHLGAIAVKTGHYTGRAANDKFFVDEPTSHYHIAWDKLNKAFDPVKFDELYSRMLAYIQGHDLFVQDCFAGADKEHRIPIRMITEKAWHSLFARNMFIRVTREDYATHHPRFTLIDLPNFHSTPSQDGTNSEAFIIINLAKCLIPYWRNQLCRTNYNRIILQKTLHMFPTRLPKSREQGKGNQTWIELKLAATM